MLLLYSVQEINRHPNYIRGKSDFFKNQSKNILNQIANVQLN